MFCKFIRDFNQWLLFYEHNINKFAKHIEDDKVKYEQESYMRNKHEITEEIIREKDKKSSIKSLNSVVFDDIGKFRKTVNNHNHALNINFF